MVPRFFLILCGFGGSCVLQILQADFSVCSRKSVFKRKIAHENVLFFRHGKPPQEGAAAFLPAGDPDGLRERETGLARGRKT